VLDYEAASPSQSIYYPSPISTPERDKGTKGGRKKDRKEMHKKDTRLKDQKRQDLQEERSGAEIQYNKIIRDAQDQAKAITERARAKAARIVAAAEQYKVDTKHKVQEIEGTAVLELWDERTKAKAARSMQGEKEKKRRHKKEKKSKKHHRKAAKQSQSEESPGY
jgi:hypothetical protein